MYLHFGLGRVINKDGAKQQGESRPLFDHTVAAKSFPNMTKLLVTFLLHHAGKRNSELLAFHIQIVIMALGKLSSAANNASTIMHSKAQVLLQPHHRHD